MRVRNLILARPDLAHVVIDQFCPPPPLLCRHRVITHAAYAYIDAASVSYSWAVNHLYFTLKIAMFNFSGARLNSASGKSY